MNLIRRTIEIDRATGARAAEIATERRHDIATLLADAVALPDSAADIAGPDIAEDRRRLDRFLATGEALPFDDIKGRVASWNMPLQLPVPSSRKIR